MYSEEEEQANQHKRIDQIRRDPRKLSDSQTITSTTQRIIQRHSPISAGKGLCPATSSRRFPSSNRLTDVVDLRREFRFAPECHASAFRGLHPDAGRSLIRLFSNSVSMPIICHMARPVGVAVSHRFLE
jgi:hypothetical protein